MPKHAPPARNYNNPKKEPITKKKTGLAFTRGLTIEQLFEKFQEDATSLQAEELALEWGSDLLISQPNFRPISIHLTSPWFKWGNAGLTPSYETDGYTDRMFISFPNSVAFHLHEDFKAEKQQTDEDLKESMFPRPGTELLLTRVLVPKKGHRLTAAQKAAAPAPIIATVSDIIEPKQSSAELVFMYPVRCGRSNDLDDVLSMNN